MPINVKHKVWIQTIRGFCCANPGSTLCAANPRITFQPALSADCACANLTMKCTRTKCTCGDIEMCIIHVYSFCCISVHLSVWRVERKRQLRAMGHRKAFNFFHDIRMRANQRRGPVGGVLLITFALRISFLYGYCSVAYRHPMSATPKGELQSQVADETRAQYHAFALRLSFYLAVG